METQARQIGETLPATTGQTTETASPGPSTAISVFTTVDFDRLPARLNDTQLAQVEAIASAKLPVVSPAEDKFIAGCLRAMAVMAKRPDDETSGEVRAKMYKRHLSGFSGEALKYLVDEAIRRHTFFPSIAECLAILRDWPNHEIANRQQKRAKVRVVREHTERMHEALRACREGLITAEELRRWPDRWLKVGETQNVVRQDDDGNWMPRPDPWFVKNRQQPGLDL